MGVKEFVLRKPGDGDKDERQCGPGNEPGAAGKVRIGEKCQGYGAEVREGSGGADLPVERK